jgi:hypothetical protein
MGDAGIANGFSVVVGSGVSVGSGEAVKVSVGVISVAIARASRVGKTARAGADVIVDAFVGVELSELV